MFKTISKTLILTGFLFMSALAFANHECDHTNFRDYMASGSIQGCNLSFLNFGDFDMSNKNWGGVNFQRSRFYNVDMSFSDFRSANFQNAYMHSVNLQGADLRGADLRGADLTLANVTGALFFGAIVTGVNFQHVRGLDRSQKEYLRTNGARLSL